jgi:cell shape-determining protein MreC
MSGGRLVDETIESVTEYFKSLYNIKKSNGKLKFQLEQRERKQSEAGMTTK